MVVEFGDAIVIVVLGGVSMAFVAANGVSAPVPEQGRQVAGVAAGAQVKLIAMTTGAGQCAVFIPDRRSVLELVGAGTAVAMATQGGASAAAAVVATAGVEAIEEHILETERLGDMAGVGGIRAVVAGAAFDAIFPRPVAGMFTMRGLVLIQSIGGISGRWWIAMTACAGTLRDESIGCLRSAILSCLWQSVQSTPS